MPRIRMLQAVAGPDFSWNPGDEIDLPGDEASKWTDGIRAELVRGQGVETPEAGPPETATAKRAPRTKSAEKA
jgi:hypothetical protein